MPMKKRMKGTTYRLVHRSYEDKDYNENNNAVWISDADLRKNGRDGARQRGGAQTHGGYTDDGEAYADDAYDYDEGAEDGDDAELFDEEGEEPYEGGPDAAQAWGTNERRGDAYAARLGDEWGGFGARKPRHLMTPEELEAVHQRETEQYKDKRNMLMAHDHEGVGDDDKLFADEVEEDFTDDFLRQLVFGDAGDDGQLDDNAAAALNDEADEDGELWRLLTEEEREAIRASKARGTARRRTAVAGGAAEDDVTYPTHDTTQRAVDRQFAEMMREFDVDARLNDACTDDPRTHGALPMDKYMTALEEFVVDRAGVNLETAEPSKNKGLIQQLKLLSHRAGVFDQDQHGGVFITTLLPDKQARFTEEFRNETEAIRRAARLRMLAKAVAARAAPGTTAPAAGVQASPSITQEDAPEEEKPEDFVVVERKARADRANCEIAASAYSSFNNQPNVIRADPVKPQRRPVTARATPSQGDETDGSAVEDDGGAVRQTSRAAAPTTRSKSETKEEKKARRQAVKAAQRERRQEKSALKKTYKEVESEEIQRSKASQAARRTVRFL